MKSTTRFSILLILHLLIQGSIYGQCTQSNYSFSTQSEIDNFPNTNPTCIEISGRLSIINSEVENLDSLIQLTQVATGISIRGNESLQNLTGLKNVVRCGNLEISNNANLTNANGIAEIEELDGNIIIVNNPRIKTFVGLNKLESIEVAVVTDNDSIFLLNAFNDIISINKLLSVNNNPNLSTLKVCTGTKSIKNVNFINLPRLVSFEGLDSLTTADTLQIINNDQLILFPKLDSLKILNGQLIIADNDTLNSIINLTSLEVVNRGLFLVNNRNLNTFSEFEKLHTIGEHVVIANNQRLGNIEGLNNVNANTPDTLIINDNQQLSICGNSFVCDYISDDSKYHAIEDNSNGCNTTMEVLDWCLVDTKSINDNSTVRLFPNPVEDVLYIDHDLQNPIPKIVVHNLMGREVMTAINVEGQISTSSLSSGKYLLSIIHGNGISTYSFIK